MQKVCVRIVLFTVACAHVHLFLEAVLCGQVDHLVACSEDNKPSALDYTIIDLPQNPAIKHRHEQSIHIPAGFCSPHCAKLLKTLPSCLCYLMH